MKKFVTVILAMFLLLALFSCGSESKNENEKKSTSDLQSETKTAVIENENAGNISEDTTEKEETSEPENEPEKPAETSSVETEKQVSEKELYEKAKKALYVPSDELKKTVEDIYNLGERKIEWLDLDAIGRNSSSSFRFLYGDDKVAVLYQPGMTQAYMTVEIGKAKFESYVGFAILVFYNGERINAKEAFEKGIVDEDTMLIAAENNVAIKDYIKFALSK